MKKNCLLDYLLVLVTTVVFLLFIRNYDPY